MNLIVTWGTPAAFAAKRATTTIPIVLGSIGDVINTGLVSNLARPDANITGFVALNVELEEKRLELLKEVVPSLSRVAVLGNSLNPLNRINLEAAHRTAKKLSIAIEGFEVRSSEEVRSALRALVEARPDVALLASDTLLLGERGQIVDTMAMTKIPAIYPFREYAEVGGFIAYGARFHPILARCRLRRSNPEGRATQQSPGSASDGIRDHRQSKGGGGAWADASRQLAGARRRGDRMSAPAASWCDPAGGSPAQVRSSVRLVASVA